MSDVLAVFTATLKEPLAQILHTADLRLEGITAKLNFELLVVKNGRLRSCCSFLLRETPS